MRTKYLIMLIASVALMMASGCKKEAKPGQLESLSFKQSSYSIAENNSDLNLRKELQTVPEGVKDTAKISYAISDETIAVMNGNFLNPQRDGDVTVTATIQGKSASCSVHITQVDIEDFSLEDFSVAINGTAQALLTTVPSGINPSRFTWSVADKSIATIDQSGVATGVKEGTTTVTATAGDITRQCKLAVKKVVVTKITLSKTELRMYEVNETFQLTAKVEPDDASYPEITWSSSNDAIVAVDSKGELRANGYPSKNEPVIITAKADNVKATCKVTLWPQQATKITFSETEHTFSKVGDTFDLYISAVEPAERTLPDEYNWAVLTDPLGLVCTINGTDHIYHTKLTKVTVKCTGLGTQTIRCLDAWSGVYAECQVTLPVKPATSINLTIENNPQNILTVGFDYKIKATVLPSDMTETLRWTVDDNFDDPGYTDFILSDNFTGTVTPTLPGKLKFKLAGSKVTGECVVTILPQSSVVYDQCGNRYKTIKIGKQWWMAENMRCNKYASGSERGSSVTLSNAATTTTSSSYEPCYYDATSTQYSAWSSDDKTLKGYMYNWAAAVGATTSEAQRNTDFDTYRQGICPSGWRLPTSDDFKTLYEYVKNEQGSEDVFRRLVSKKYWNKLLSKDYDMYGFSLLPAGYHEEVYHGGSDYKRVGSYAPLWSSSVMNGANAYIFDCEIYFGERFDVNWKTSSFKTDFSSVRCVKD